MELTDARWMLLEPIAFSCEWTKTVRPTLNLADRCRISRAVTWHLSPTTGEGWGLYGQFPACHRPTERSAELATNSAALVA